jgi:2-methylcitrate dehydratase PrpD
MTGSTVLAKEDAARTFARSAATITFDDLPPAAVRAAKLRVFDTLAVTLAATGVAPDLDQVTPHMLRAAAAAIAEQADTSPPGAPLLPGVQTSAPAPRWSPRLSSAPQ